MSTDFRTLFGARLQEERKRLGLNQEELADKLGTKKRTLQDWERGLFTASADILASACTLGIDVLYLLGAKRSQVVGSVTNDSVHLSEQHQTLIQHFDASDEKTKSAILHIIVLAAGQPHLLNGARPDPISFPLRVDPHNRYASPDGVQPSPAQLDLRSPAAMFLAEQFDAVPPGARDVVHSMCIKLMRDYPELLENGLNQWIDRRESQRPESTERRTPRPVRVADPALKK